MTRDELIQKLSGYEWNEIEFKASQRGVSDSAYETVSAYANTEGGWLVFGVRENNGSHEICGVEAVDTVQNNFLSALRAGNKLNRIIQATPTLIEEDGKAVLVFYIPEARRQEKPVYLNGDIRKSFIRRGGGDERCTPTEIEKFLREASAEVYDGQTIDLDAETCFDSAALDWYRGLFYERNAHQDRSFSHLEFLHHWGLVVEQDHLLKPTRAAILLFGSIPCLLQVLPRPIVDYQAINSDWDSAQEEQRWDDRIVCEENLIQAWRNLLAAYYRQAEKPFSLQAGTLQRSDEPPDYIAFREAIINLLIHQDYSDHSRKASIKFYRDRAVIWNPGESFEKKEKLLESGEKEVRNPRLVSAFRRIGLSEQAGSGVRAIYGNWRQLGRIPPQISNDKTEKTFEICLLKKALRSEQQVLFEASLGVRLSPHEAATFALACQQSEIRITDVKGVTGLSGGDCQGVLTRLVTQVLLQIVGNPPHHHYELASHLRERLFSGNLISDQPGARTENLVSDQPSTKSENLVSDQPRPLGQLSETQRKILFLCDLPHSLALMMSEIGVTHRTFFRRTHLEPMIIGGLIKLTYPDQPNHPDQAYVLTEIGAELKEKYLSEKQEQSGDE